MNLPSGIEWAMRVAVAGGLGGGFIAIGSRWGAAEFGRWRAWAATLWMAAVAMPWPPAEAGSGWALPVSLTARPLPDWLFLAWIAGVIVLGVRRLRATRVLQQWRRSSIAGSEPWISSAHALGADILGVCDFRFVAGLRAPAVRGGPHPVLFLPDTANHWDDATRRQVLLHEADHIRHRDHWILNIWNLLDLFFWWSPAWWWVRNGMAIEIERSVDAAVVAHSPDERGAYARLLLEMGTGRPVSGLAGFAAGVLESRIRNILRTPSPPPGVGAWMALAGSLVLLAIVGALVARTSLTPDPTTIEAHLRLTADPFPLDTAGHR